MKEKVRETCFVSLLPFSLSVGVMAYRWLQDERKRREKGKYLAVFEEQERNFLKSLFIIREVFNYAISFLNFFINYSIYFKQGLLKEGYIIILKNEAKFMSFKNL